MTLRWLPDVCLPAVRGSRPTRCVVAGAYRCCGHCCRDARPLARARACQPLRLCPVQLHACPATPPGAQLRHTRGEAGATGRRTRTGTARRRARAWAHKTRLRPSEDERWTTKLERVILRAFASACHPGHRPSMVLGRKIVVATVILIATAATSSAAASSAASAPSSLAPAMPRGSPGARVARAPQDRLAIWPTLSAAATAGSSFRSAWTNHCATAVAAVCDGLGSAVCR